ncbi:MarR family winged helix-turn-helix transcriptional regulator [Zavarzinia sp. CC-PAN008]|uniref:MarR family winged helix-turn-helix transcriptional regulator n=1 Tax=Zavarzinia sp. CC-PAN008 TaxID=3243332 RepID=UPI003F74A0B6
MTDQDAAGEGHADLFRFLTEVGIIAQLSGTAFQKVMAPPMTLPQFAVLHHLTRVGGDKTPLHIATALQVSKGAMTNTLGHLERAGWINVRPDARDGRSKRVDLSPAGIQAHRDAVAAIAPELAWLAGAIGGKPIAAVLPLLEAVRTALDRRRD